MPEKRTERTTEGGLDAVKQRAQLEPVVHALKHAGIRVSLFIAAQPAQIEAAAALGAPVIEIHTGAWCDALAGERRAEAEAEWQLIRAGAVLAASFGLEVHAGHGLDYASAETIAALPQIVELNIGHFLVGEAVFEGLAETVKFMRAAMDRGRTEGSAHDHRARLRHGRRAAHRAHHRAPRRAFSRAHLHAAERAKAERRANRVETYAKRFAAKEACSKALGTGFRSGVFWRDMGVVNLPSGRPTMQLTGGALKRLQAITPAGCEAKIDVSLTDEGPTAQAIVIISAVTEKRRVDLKT